MKHNTRAVVIGGGIAGCSILYHLTKLGWTDVVLLEKGELTGGSTWHSVGNTPMFTTSLNLLRLLKYSVELYQTLEAETGQHVGFHRVGSLRLAPNRDVLDWYRGLSDMASIIGVSFEMVSAEEAKRLNPLISTDGLLGASYIAADGYIDPSSVTTALAAGARQRGAEIYRSTRVLALTPQSDGTWQIETNRGILTADIVINAAGQWAREIGQLAGVELPVVPFEHQYVVTEAIPELKGLGREIPVTRDPHKSFYLRQEGDGLLIGLYETGPNPWSLGGIPKEFGQQLLTSRFEQIEKFMLGAVERVPPLGHARIKKIVNGPDGYTPDGRCIMGPVPGTRNFYVMAGFSSFGITFGGGAGKCLAEWIVEGQPGVDVWELDVRRYGDYAGTTTYLVAKTTETYEKEFAVHYPHEERPAGRPLKTSPIYHSLKSQGAVYGVRYGWERPLWFAPAGTQAVDEYSFYRPNWFEQVGRECLAVRERVGVLDQTSFAKFEVTGSGVTTFLEHLCSNRVGGPVGKIVYTQMLNERGGIECDVTVTRMSENQYMVVTAAALANHDFAWIQWHLPSNGSVSIRDVTGRFAVLSLMGPRARDVLQKLTDDDVSNKGFPFMTCKDIHVGAVPVRAYRVSYVGERGWELYHPIEYQRRLYDQLMNAGQEFEIVNYGYRALESLRMEKGYRFWGFDMSALTTPYEAGLGQFVKLNKREEATGAPYEFIGRGSLIRQQAQGIAKTLACLIVEGNEAIPHGWEPVLYANEIVGYVTSGDFGHFTGKTVVLAYLPIECGAPGTRLAIKILGESFDATVVTAPLYDPTNSRLKE